MPMIYTTLSANRRNAVTWMQLVVIWQVVGRLVRGGVPAQVFFVDDAFNPSWQDDQGQSQPVSLLQEMERVLQPYFTPDSTEPERALVEALYEPLYLALRSMRLGKES
jgi:hypothetical protein